MLVALVTVGVLLIVFGGLVLLRFPDRPGGEFEFHGVRVQSVGAGLPLIVLGLVAVTLAALQGVAEPESGSASPTTPAGGGSVPGTALTTLTSKPELTPPPNEPTTWPEPESCLEELFEKEPPVDEAFRTLLPVGQTVPVLGGIPVALILTEAGETTGAVRFTYAPIPGPPTLTIYDTVDATCQPGTAQIRDVTKGFVVAVTLPDRNYEIAVTYESSLARPRATLRRV